MFDWIPLQYYTAIHYHVLLLVALMILYHSTQYDIGAPSSIRFFNAFGYVVVLVYIFYIGLRPISGKYFGDTANYAAVYKLLQQGEEIIIKNDYLFNYFMRWCSRFLTIHQFYLLLDVLYVLPCVFFTQKYFGRYWFFAMFLFLSSLSFWSYGSNGLRNGLGTSIFITALCFYNKKVWMYLLFAISYFMHASLIIPIAAFVVSGLYKNPKFYHYLWLFAIPLSLAGGGFWGSFFGSLGFAEDRTSGYLTGGEEFKSQFSQTGFRWDFLFYSSFAVFAGWYFIFKKGITDKFYIHLWGTYMIANAFWILVIRANFSNRFAYLSWFLMAAVIAYPMLRYKIWPNQYRIVGVVIAVYYLFTYFMFLKG